MTGATGVHLLLWSEDRQDWLLPAPGSDAGAAPVSGTGTNAVPMSVLRYVQRTVSRWWWPTPPAMTGSPATRTSPTSAAARCWPCPILSRGMLRAVLLLENRLIRGAFTTGRLDAVKLIAGQLAVSLDNAQLYAGFRRIADEQATLRRVATLVARGVRPDVVFAAVAEEVGALLGADTAAIVRFDPDAQVTVMGGSGSRTGGRARRGTLDPRLDPGDVQSTGRAAGPRCGRPAGEPARDQPRQVSAAPSPAPIVVEGRLWGVIAVGSRRVTLPAGHRGRLAGFTELVATAVANAESRAELTASRARIVATADQTRAGGSSGTCTTAPSSGWSPSRCSCGRRGAAVPPELGDLAGQLDRAAAGATGAVEELREIARGIHPAILAEGGLRRALKMLARRSPIPVDLAVRAGGGCPSRSRSAPTTSSPRR